MQFLDSSIPQGMKSSEELPSLCVSSFSFQVLQVDKSSGIDDIGAPIWKLAACVLVVYCLLYLSLFKGVKSSGKVVWVTALAPYFLLSILLGIDHLILFHCTVVRSCDITTEFRLSTYLSSI